MFRGYVISFRIQDNEHFAVFEQASSKIFSRERQWVSTWDGNDFYFNTLPIDFEEWKISNFIVIGDYIVVDLYRRNYSEYTTLLSKDGTDWRILTLPNSSRIYSIPRMIDADIFVSPVLGLVDIQDLPKINVLKEQVSTK